MVVPNDHFLGSLNDRFQRSLFRSLNNRFHRSLFRIVEVLERSFPTISSCDRLTTDLYNSFLRSLNNFFNDSFLRSFNDLFHRSISFQDRWTVVLNDPSSQLGNNRSQRSLCKIVERSFPTILVFHLWTISSKDPFLRSLNDRFQRSLSRIDELSSPPIRFTDCWTILFKDHLLRSSNDRFQRSLFRSLNNRFHRSLFRILEALERSFPTISSCDRLTTVLYNLFLRSLNNVFNDSFLGSINDHFHRSISFQDRWTVVLNEPFS